MTEIAVILAALVGGIIIGRLSYRDEIAALKARYAARIGALLKELAEAEKTARKQINFSLDT